MNSKRHSQRGDGKVGCVLSLLVLLVLVAAGAKLVPYWWDVDQLVNTADDLASRAGTIANTPQAAMETIKTQLIAKARERELPEATKAGAISITVSPGSDGSSGMCTIKLHFARNIDFYGITSTTWATDKVISKPWGRY